MIQNITPLMTGKEFWEMADETKLKGEYKINDNLKWMQEVTQDELKQLFAEYRVFTIWFADDLSLLTAKLPHGKLKSMMAELVHEELGEGNPKYSHLTILDEFIVSLGVNRNELDKPTMPENIALLEEQRRLLLDKPSTYGVALRGMGGECICQTYLTVMHYYLCQNPYIKANKPSLDWRWWNIHTGEVDIAHNQMVKASIDELIQEKPESVNELASGYRHAKEFLEKFWENIYALVRSNQKNKS
ncbi:iron-containing redox enzyme family protein [Mastigocoleus testarum]|uniref:TenA family transcriptional regulator n=1 Tax=Mastigocoleus testarum BC008 TaxID=371196 RepID=A0A0V7ZQS5_9CYAN|nr:iron-containing redox enzyme family protein [Mastigocoleus testarum]KST66810.1 hypothetical protein BC008_26860 [Mastigocoleus testarum BC008]